MLLRSTLLLCLVALLGGHISSPAVSRTVTVDVMPDVLEESSLAYVPDTSDLTPEAVQDLVTDLPGLSILGKRRMFSGYLPVDGEGRGSSL